MRAWLLIFALTTSGCASFDVELAPVGDDLRSYQAEAYEPPEDLIALDPPEIAGECVFQGEPAAALAGFDVPRLRTFLEAAKANTETAAHLLAAIENMQQERDRLLASGRIAEAQAELYRALYLDERHRGLWGQILGAASAAGGLILLGAGAL